MNRDLKKFNEGKHEYRPAPFWSWNDKLDKKELLAQMRAISEAGYGGFFMHSRVGLITPYLSEEWMECIRLCAEESERFGLDAYLYDEDMWPSGYASGAVPAASDDFKEKALVLVREGELRSNDKVLKEVEYQGERALIAARTCASGMVRFNGQCYIDVFNPKAVQTFLQSTHEKYRERVGDLFGNKVRGIFTDEPCYGIHWFYPMPHVTYSEYLRERILREKGYDIAEKCEELFFDAGDFKRTRCDYYTCAAEQFCESFTKQYAAWCQKNKLALTGHFMAEESLIEQTQWTGGVMRHYAVMQRPGVDKLMRKNTQLVTLKQLTSVTEQLEKECALSECFAGMGHESGFYMRKRVMDWQAVNGITFVNMHLSHYSLRGERKRDYPPDIFYQQPYFKEEKLFSDYAARLSQLAAYGKRDVRVLIVHPLSTALANYSPVQPSETLRRCDRDFAELSQTLQESAIDFHYGDESILAEHAKAQGKTLRVGNCEYDTVILCRAESLQKSTVELLSSFGGRILSLGEPPALSEYREKVCLNVSERFESVGELADALQEYKIYGVPRGVICCRRKGERGDVLLFVNQTEGELMLNAKELSFALDLTRGVSYPLPDTVKLLPHGCLAAFAGDEKTLREWEIPLSQTPAAGCDGVVFFGYEAREIPVPRAEVCNENALVLDRADFEAAGVRLHDSPLEGIWHYHFYKLPEGTPYTMRFRFTVKELPAEPVQIVVENAENAERITLNGEPVRPMRERGAPQRLDESAYIDLSFTRCACNGLRLGENVIEIRAKKINNITEVCCHRPVTEREFYPTEAEAVYVIGNFSLAKGENGYEIAAGESPEKNVAEEGYPFYSGALEYEVFAEGGDTLLLDCDCVYATIEANGKKQAAGAAPYVFQPIEGRGKTKVIIRLYNSLFALLGPHHIENYDGLDWVDAGVFNDLAMYCKEPLVKPFGLYNIKIIKGVKTYES